MPKQSTSWKFFAKISNITADPIGKNRRKNARWGAHFRSKNCECGRFFLSLHKIVYRFF